MAKEAIWPFADSAAAAGDVVTPFLPSALFEPNAPKRVGGFLTMSKPLPAVNFSLIDFYSFIRGILTLV